LLQVLFDLLLRFSDVDGQRKYAFGGELVIDGVDQRFFVFAVSTAGGPELEQDDFSLDRGVSMALAGECLGMEAGSRLAVVRASETAEGGGERDQ